MFSSFLGANSGSAHCSIMAVDPRRKLKKIRIISIIDACTAAISILLHTWIFILEIISGRSNLAIYVGLSLFLISFGILIICSWKLLDGLKQHCIKPLKTIETSTEWKNWSEFSLILVIIILVILVISSILNRGSTQLYIMYLLGILAWKIYGIYIIRKFIQDTICLTSGPDNRIYFVPSGVKTTGADGTSALERQGLGAESD